VQYYKIFLSTVVIDIWCIGDKTIAKVRSCSF